MVAVPRARAAKFCWVLSLPCETVCVWAGLVESHTAQAGAVRSRRETRPTVPLKNRIGALRAHQEGDARNVAGGQIIIVGQFVFEALVEGIFDRKLVERIP